MVCQSFQRLLRQTALDILAVLKIEQYAWNHLFTNQKASINGILLGLGSSKKF